MHLAVEHDFHPESQGAIRGTARVTWDWDEDRICLKLAWKEASLTVLNEGKGQIWAVGLLCLSAYLPG